MTRAALEMQVLHELRHLPLEQAQEALDFVVFLRSRRQQQNQQQDCRPIGILHGKAFCQFSEEFEMTDEELLRS